jgi:hypothetical protein
MFSSLLLQLSRVHLIIEPARSGPTGFIRRWNPGVFSIDRGNLNEIITMAGLAAHYWALCASCAGTKRISQATSRWTKVRAEELRGHEDSRRNKKASTVMQYPLQENSERSARGDECQRNNRSPQVVEGDLRIEKGRRDLIT